MSKKAYRLVGTSLAIMASSAAAGHERPAVTGPQSADMETHSTAPEAVSHDGLQDIVVTANRRDQRLQDVPVAISVVSGDALTTQGILKTSDLGQVVSGLNIPVIGISIAPYLRGIGSQDVNPNAEPSVALYVDGVYIPAANGALMGLSNVERVEVLKGPQGTLFGRNAVGGVIQIITRKPQHDPLVEVSGGYGNYDTVQGQLYATTGLTSDLAIDVAGKYYDQQNGWGRNLTLGIDTYRYKEAAISSSLLLTPGETTTIRLKGDFSRIRGSQNDYQLDDGAIGFNGVPELPNKYDTVGDHRHAYTTKQRGLSLHINQDLGFAQGVSISSYRKTTSTFTSDVDATSFPFFSADFHYAAKVATQEFQVLANPGSRFNWIAGVYLYANKSGYIDTDLFGAFFPAGVLRNNVSQRTHAWAAYAQAETVVFADTTLTTGIRYSKDHRKADAEIHVIGDPDNVFPSRKANSAKVTWRLALGHEFTPDVDAYASWNRGFRSGGFQIFNPASDQFEPETLDAYEIGLKTQLFDRKLRLNLAAFYYKSKNIQVTVLPADGAQITANAAAAAIKGLDVDFEFRPARELSLTGSAEFLQAKYDDYPGAVSQPVSACTQPVFACGGQIVPDVVFNAAGKHLVNAPKFAGNVTLNYAIPSAVGEFTVSPSLSYNDGFYWTPDNVNREGSYTIVNATLRWTSTDEHLGASLWVSNLTAAYYRVQGTSFALGTLYAPGAPRTYGVTLNARF